LQGESQQGKLNTTKTIAGCAGNTLGRGLKGCKSKRKDCAQRSSRMRTTKAIARCAGSTPGSWLEDLKLRMPVRTTGAAYTQALLQAKNID
jgi:hypothetical protein